MKATVAPFLQPDASLVDHGGWSLVEGGTESDLPSELPHWDYQTTLVLAAAVSVDRTEILRQCELDPATPLRVIVSARSDLTTTHSCVATVEIPDQDRYDLAVELELPGQTLGGRLELRTMVVTGEPVALSELAPARPGSILWRVSHRTLLEGSGARFPTDAADFGQTRPSQSGAAWYLQLDTSDPETSFMSAARVTLNTASPDIRRLLAGEVDGTTETLLRTLRWDVTRQLVLRALASEDIVDGPPNYESTSVAAVLRGLLAQIWPLDEPSALRQRMRQSPEFIELQIQHHTRLAP